MRARMALIRAGRTFRVVEVSLRNKPGAMLALSSKGTVPVLHLPGGRVLEESWDIMQWAWAANDREDWWNSAQSAENRNLLGRNDGEFKRHLDLYKYPNRYPDETLAAESLRMRALKILLQPLEERLQQQPYLGGTNPCATDLAIFPFVRQFAAVDREWFAAQPMPALQAWLAEWLNSDLFALCMARQGPQQIMSSPTTP